MLYNKIIAEHTVKVTPTQRLPSPTLSVDESEAGESPKKKQKVEEVFNKKRLITMFKSELSRAIQQKKLNDFNEITPIYRKESCPTAQLPSWCISLKWPACGSKDSKRGGGQGKGSKRSSSRTK